MKARERPEDPVPDPYMRESGFSRLAEPGIQDEKIETGDMERFGHVLWRDLCVFRVK